MKSHTFPTAGPHAEPTPPAPSRAAPQPTCGAVQSVSSPRRPFLDHQLMLDHLHHMETIAAIQEGMASAERGELKPAAQVLAEMQAKYRLSR